MTTNKQRIDKAMKELGREFKRRASLRDVKRTDLEKIGNQIIKEMKADIKKGTSPITGAAFPAYKNPKRYPGKRKPHKPVNLKLTGKFLADLTTKIKTGKFPSIAITFKTALSKKKEDGHRKGVNKQPKRPIIPGSGESFSSKLLKRLRPRVAKILSKYF